MTTPVYTYADPDTGGTVLTTAGWPAEPPRTGTTPTYLGAPFAVAATGGPGLVPVQPLVDPATGDHLYSVGPAETDRAVRNGYRPTGRPFHVATSPRACLQPVHRFDRGRHHRYAPAVGTAAPLVAAGWHDAGTAFYARPISRYVWPPTTDRGPLNRPPYLPTDSQAWHAYQAATDQAERVLLYQIAATPSAIWLGASPSIGDYVSRVMSQARQRGETPQFVLYAIPHRDCGRYSAGGLPDGAAYRGWIDQIATAVGAGPAIVVVEPDALGMSCLSVAQQRERVALLHYAISAFSARPEVWTYIHAGSGGSNVPAIIDLLTRVDIGAARGLALNVSSFDTTPSEVSYGSVLLHALAAQGITDKHLIIDTSRNGLGRPAPGSGDVVPRWCNPSGRALGVRPSPLTGNPDVDAYLWIKPPGESDGQCHPGDPRGWFGSYALGLARRGIDTGTVLPLPVP